MGNHSRLYTLRGNIVKNLRLLCNISHRTEREKVALCCLEVEGNFAIFHLFYSQTNIWEEYFVKLSKNITDKEKKRLLYLFCSPSKQF